PLSSRASTTASLFCLASPRRGGDRGAASGAGDGKVGIGVTSRRGRGRWRVGWWQRSRRNVAQAARESARAALDRRAVGGKMPHTLRDDEGVAADGDRNVMMPAEEASPFEVVEPQLALHLFVDALGAISFLEETHELLFAHRPRQRRQRILGGRRFAIVGALLAARRPRASLVAENLVLRQQLAILRRANPRPRLRPIDRAFWVVVSRVWSRWADSLAIVAARGSATRPSTSWT